MSRVAFALLLAALTALAVAHCDPVAASAQDKKDKTDKVPAPADGVEDDLSRVLPVFDPGSHTRPITAMGFTTDQSKLVTVAQDFTVQVWDTATGERLDLLRLPGYGREKGYDSGRWDVAAVSADGTRVAIGGERKFFAEVEGKTKVVSHALLVDVPARRVVRLDVALNPSGGGRIDTLAFSPGGDRLAVGMDKQGKDNYYLQVIGGLADRVSKSTRGVATGDCRPVRVPHTKPLSSLAFSPDGKQLLVGSADSRVSRWDVPAGPAPTPTLAKEIEVEGSTQALDWSPDGKQFARVANGGQKGAVRAIELWGAGGVRAKAWKADDMNAVFAARAGQVFTVEFLDPNTLYFVGNGPAEKKTGGASLAGTIDITTGQDRRVAAVSDGMLNVPTGAAAADGRRFAVTVAGNTEALIGTLAGGARVRCGVQNQLPHHVGWAKDPARPGFAWTDEWHSGKAEPTADILRSGFDLTRVEPLGAIKGADYLPATRKIGEWTLDFPGRKEGKEDGKGLAQLKQGGKFVQGFAGAKGIGHTLVPNGDRPPLVAFADHTEHQGDAALLHRADGTRVTRYLPQATRIHDMAASPDGRFVIATTGTPRVVVYRTDGTPYPLLSFAQLNGEWVVWTPEGYYAASPGGERMFGWAVNNGPNELAAFHPAVRFAKQFRRPDVIRLAIEKGSVRDALAALKTVTPEVERILPPTAKLELVETRGAKVTVKASASSGVRDKPVTAMRVMMDGVALPDRQGVWAGAAGKPAEAVFTFDVTTPGPHVLRVLAYSDDGPAVSDPVELTVPRSVGPQPTLHRVCVGINDYTAEKKLTAATKDARDVFDALGRECVGPDNVYGAAEGEVILDADATRGRVLKAVADRARATRPGDLVVVFFATHGYQQGDHYYLLTRDADHTKPLDGVAVSGADLQKALEKAQCPVLLVLDSCYSGGASGTFLLTRGLTDDATGVTVLSAATGLQEAGSSAENGYLTAGLLRGLRAADGGFFNPTSRQVWTHHLYAAAFDAAWTASRGKQTPCLTPPLGGSSLLLRQVPKK